MQISEIEISFRPQRANKPKIVGPECAAEILRPYFEPYMEYREAFKVMPLTNANRVLGVYEHSWGGRKSATVDIAQIFGVLLKCNASAFIVAHNHPSGELRASREDIELCRKIKSAASIFGLSFFDSLIFTESGYYSMNTDGLL